MAAPKFLKKAIDAVLPKKEGETGVVRDASTGKILTKEEIDARNAENQKALGTYRNNVVKDASTGKILTKEEIDARNQTNEDTKSRYKELLDAHKAAGHSILSKVLPKKEGEPSVVRDASTGKILTKEEKEQKPSTSDTSETSDTSDTSETSSEQEAEIEQEASTVEGVTEAIESKDPNKAKEALVNYALAKGIAYVDDKGNIKYKTTAASVSSQIGNVLSALLCVVSGGVIPPVNFYKISGAEGEDKARQEAYATMMNNIADYTGEAEGAKEFSRGISEQEATEAGTKGRQIAGEEQALQQQLDNEIAVMKQSNANAKDLAHYAANLEANKLPMVLKAMEKSGYTKDQLIEMVNAMNGVWSSAQLQRLNAGISTAKSSADVIKTVADAVKPTASGNISITDNQLGQIYDRMMQQQRRNMLQAHRGILY